MAYIEIRFRVPGGESEALGEALDAMGAMAVTMQNGGNDEFYEAAHPQRPEWVATDVTGLFPETVDGAAVVSAIGAGFPVSNQPRVSRLEEEDWERSCLSGFAPVRVGRELWVVPSWMPPPVADAVNLVVDPGLAFGTGTHPTTALCLSWLDSHRPEGLDVVDFGCGSGILGIAALKLGAARAWGVDVDSRALATSRDNAARNGVAGRFVACTVDALDDGFSVPLVMANILAAVLIDLRERLASLVRPGGVILLTGILERQADEVRSAFESCFEVGESRRDGWSLLVGARY